MDGKHSHNFWNCNACIIAAIQDLCLTSLHVGGNGLRNSKLILLLVVTLEYASFDNVGNTS